MFSVISALLGVILICAIFLAIKIARFACETDTHQSDVAIVLGAAVANEMPTPVFEQRIQHAITLYRTGVVPHLILTGGLGAGDRFTESEVARNYCLARGIPPQAISIETRSHSTEENLQEAQKILVAQQFHRALIVSDPLHEHRAITIANDLGIDAYPSPTPTTRYVGVITRGGFLLRETYFHMRYLLLRLLK